VRGQLLTIRRSNIVRVGWQSQTWSRIPIGRRHDKTINFWTWTGMELRGDWCSIIRGDGYRMLMWSLMRAGQLEKLWSCCLGRRSNTRRWLKAACACWGYPVHPLIVKPMVAADIARDGVGAPLRQPPRDASSAIGCCHGGRSGRCSRQRWEGWWRRRNGLGVQAAESWAMGGGRCVGVGQRKICLGNSYWRWRRDLRDGQNEEMDEGRAERWYSY
jgi:hypothetical protein